MEPYIPETLPLDIAWVDHIPLISKANTALARYDGLLEGIVNPDILLSPLAREEAVLSSRIEGSLATMQEALLFEINPDDPVLYERRSDFQEVLNYRKALCHATNRIGTRPMSLHLIRELHEILLGGVRGHDKEPGAFRDNQNRIGKPGSKPEQAIFLPPSPEQVMPSLDNWATYINDDDKDALVQIAVIKAQFELIHPFLDGNGRVGRMLVPLLLYYKAKIARPVFYISAYLQKNRDEYYERLKAISRDQDWNGWISFFLQAIVEQSQINTNKAKEIQALYEKLKARSRNILRSGYSIDAIDALFTRPIFTTPIFASVSNIPIKSAQNLIKKLIEAKIVEVIRKGRGRRVSIMEFPELLKITE